MNVGGAVRWEDHGAIGYYGVQKLPAVITDLDPKNPIYDRPNLGGGGIRGNYFFLLASCLHRSRCAGHPVRFVPRARVSHP